MSDDVEFLRQVMIKYFERIYRQESAMAEDARRALELLQRQKNDKDEKKCQKRLDKGKVWRIESP